MQHRPLGRMRALVGEVGLGTWEMSGDAWGHKSESEYVHAIAAALDAGVNYFDTALEYGNGYSEQIIGRTIRGHAAPVVISTKVPPKCGVWGPTSEKSMEEFFPSSWIVACCEQSLRNLQRDYIDILFLHTWSVSWAHCVDWYDTMSRLRQQGKIRAIGICVSDRRAHEANVHIEAGRVDAVEVAYSIFEQDPEYTLFPLARKHNVGIVARSPFSSGAIIGNWDKQTVFEPTDWRRVWAPEHWLDEQMEMARRVAPVIRSTGLCNSDAALRFILDNSAVSTVIPGSSNPRHIRQNALASKLPALADEIRDELKRLWLKGAIHGVYNGG